jgi:hypothetical protein
VKTVCWILIFCAVIGFSQAAETQDQLSGQQIQAMKERLATITDPAMRLFFQANIYRAEGETEQALQALAELNALHARETKWIGRSELLSAKLYLELGMLLQADATARQVQLFYEGTDLAEQAGALREQIKQSKESSPGADEERSSE